MLSVKQNSGTGPGGQSTQGLLPARSSSVCTRASLGKSPAWVPLIETPLCPPACSQTLLLWTRWQSSPQKHGPEKQESTVFVCWHLRAGGWVSAEARACECTELPRVPGTHRLGHSETVKWASCLSAPLVSAGWFQDHQERGDCYSLLSSLGSQCNCVAGGTGPKRWCDSHFSLPPTRFIMPADSDCPCVDTSITQKNVMCCRPRMAFQGTEGCLFQAHTYLVSRGHAKGVESDIRNRLMAINTGEPDPVRAYAPWNTDVCVSHQHRHSTQRTEPSLTHLPTLTWRSRPLIIQVYRCALFCGPPPGQHPSSLSHTQYKRPFPFARRGPGNHEIQISYFIRFLTV